MKTIALVSHDAKKTDMLSWATYNREFLEKHKLVATNTTGNMLKDALGLDIECMLSGPRGGDSQISARIAQGEVDVVIFFWDGLTAHEHDVDIKALLRIAVLYEVVTACNRTTADYVVSSPLMSEENEKNT